MFNLRYHFLMQMKIILKVLFLVLCLIAAFGLMRLISSTEFKGNLNDVFTSGGKTMKWCPDHVIDYHWNEHLDSPFIQTEFKNAPAGKIAEAFCSLPIDDFENEALAFKEFEPLLSVQSAEAKGATLEWNSKEKLFRVQGLVFKSKRLTERLQK